MTEDEKKIHQEMAEMFAFAFPFVFAFVTVIEVRINSG
jgi:hypothetical protein